MEMEATGAPQNHYHTLNQQVGSITVLGFLSHDVQNCQYPALLA